MSMVVFSSNLERMHPQSDNMCISIDIFMKKWANEVL